MLRLLQGDVAEEGADRRQSGVASAGAVAAFGLESVQELP